MPVNISIELGRTKLTYCLFADLTERSVLASHITLQPLGAWCSGKGAPAHRTRLFTSAPGLAVLATILSTFDWERSPLV